MKKIFTALFLMGAIVSTWAQEAATEHKVDANTFRLQFFNLAQAEFITTYEHKFKKTSILIHPVLKYRNKDAQLAYGIDNNYRNEMIGIGGALEFRRYLADLKLDASREEIRKGLYMSVYGAYNYYYLTSFVEEYVVDPNGGSTRDDVVEKKDEYINFQGAMLFGVQEIFYDALVIDFYIGAGLKIAQGIDANGSYFYDMENSNNVFSSKYSGIIPKIGLSIGFAF